MVNKIKLSFGEPNYYVNEAKRTVACTLSGEICGIETINWIDQWVDVCGIAKCHPEDEFDVEIGKRIAHAKAESTAYKVANAQLNKTYWDAFNKVKAMDNFNDRVLMYNLHNDKYIKNLAK